MSLHAWDWEDEDVESMEPMGALSNFCQSMSECQVEECLSAKAQESESDQQYSSSRSPDGRASTFNSEVPQVVPCKFIISLAFPVNICPKGKCVRLVEKHKKHPKMDKPAAKGHRTYHIEYFLLPDDKEPKKVDLVVFPAVVKVLLDSGVKTVKPWHEGDKVWVSWTQNFDINVTKELLKKINFYKITLMLWDTTDKVSKKVRYFRLKNAGCLEDTESLDEVKRLVLNQRRPSEASIQVNEEWNQEYEPGKPEKAGKLLKPFHVKWKEAERGRKNQKKRKKYPAEEEADPKLADYWAQGAFSIQLAVMPLLAEVPIMSEEQKQDLNPLIIKIKGVSCLPSQPVPIHELKRLCTPVYCRYQFHKAPVHQTEGQPHGSRVSFQDINVIFLGAIHPSDLREYLEGPPMVVEVHDRDRKSEEYSRKPTLFGEDPLDSYLNFQAFISPKETENNPFESQNKTWDPYGIARVSFADLLLGQKYLNLAVPIHSCESKPIHHGQDSRSRKVVGFRVPTDVLHCGPMPMGNYLEANSLLKLRVDIAVPLQAAAAGPEPDLAVTQFGRIIFVFDSRKSSLLYSVLQDITMINARALDLDSYPMATIRQILSAFKVRVKIQERQDLDVLTGFHLLDGKTHLLILEGLADQGLKRLWESHQGRITKSEYRKHKVLYNSQLLFQHRLYADMDTILYHVHLFKPLSQLMKHMALYLHNSVMKKAFQTLTRIYYICHYTTKLREVITRDLLPSSAMIKDLSQKFGLPISLEELTDGNFVAMLPHPTSNLEDFRSRNSTLNYEILAHQEKYLQWRNVMMSRNKSQNHSLIQKNIKEAYQVSKKPPKLVVKVIRSAASAKDVVHNYSIQTLNSTELGKKELYREMAKEPRKRFTYSQNFLSAMVEPQDPEEEEKKAKKKSRQAWLTTSGFQVTGLHRSAERDHHPKLLPIYTASELTEVHGEEQGVGWGVSGDLPPNLLVLIQEWRENALFANKLKPVLDRERWSWDRRHRDFDLYKKPPPSLWLPTSPALNPAAGRKMKKTKESDPVS